MGYVGFAWFLYLCRFVVGFDIVFESCLMVFVGLLFFVLCVCMFAVYMNSLFVDLHGLHRMVNCILTHCFYGLYLFFNGIL